MELTNKAIKEAILTEMEHQGITTYQLADEIGMRRQTLYSYLSGATEGTNSVTLAKNQVTRYQQELPHRSILCT